MEQKANLKEMTPKKRAEHIWEYYKIPIIGGIAAFLIAASLLHHYLSYKETILDIMLINSHNEYMTYPGIEEYFSLSGFDEKKQKITVDTTNYYVMDGDDFVDDPITTQSISVKLIVSDVDVFAAPDAIFAYYANMGYLRNLREVFTEEELLQYESCLFYAKDTETGELYPCGITPASNRWLIDNSYYTTSCPIGLVAHSEYAKNGEDFLRYLLSFEKK